MNKSFRIILGIPRTLCLLLYIKFFHSAAGWKYLFGAWNCFRFDGGGVSLKRGVWLEPGALIHCCGGLISIGERSFINRNTSLVSRVSITIGDDALIGDHVSIYDHDHSIKNLKIPYGQQGFSSKAVRVHNNVWIGSHSVILKGVDIGEGAVIAAGSVVTKDIPAHELWAGVPARHIKSLKVN